MPVHVAMVVHSLNHNNMGRVFPFLRAFQDSPTVCPTLIGWDTTGRLFPLLDDLRVPVVRLSGPLTGPQAQQQLAAAVQGCELIHCFKNREHLHTVRAVAEPRGLPVVLDLDDWELGLYLEGVARWPAWRRWLWGGPITRHIGAALELETLARTYPAALLVNSSALQAHFGGQRVYTAADAAELAAGPAAGAAFRAAHGLGPGPVLGFLGTPHPHKGIPELLAAFAAVRDAHPAAQLVFVGVPAHNGYRESLAATPGVVIVDYVGVADYAAAHAACDLVAIPQRAVTEGIMQTPAKLIMAMAAGAPIVATTVGDMPQILGAAGVLVPPAHSQALAAAFLELLADPARRQRLGAAARQRFLEHWTLDALRSTLEQVYADALVNNH